MCTFLKRLLGREPARPRIESPPSEELEMPLDPLPPPVEEPREPREQQEPRDANEAHEPREPRAPTLPEPTPYGTSAEYLADELSRIQSLVQAYLYARNSDAVLALHRESRALPKECQALFGDPNPWDTPVAEPDCQRTRNKHLATAEAWERYIVARLRLTNEHTRHDFRVWRLTRTFNLVPNLVPVMQSEKAVPRQSVPLDLILLALLVDRSARYRAALASVASEDGTTSAGLTADVYLRIVQPRTATNELDWNTLAPHSILRRYDLLRVGEAEYSARQSVRIDSRVAEYLLGNDTPDAALGDAVTAVTKAAQFCHLGVDESIQDEVRALANWWNKWPSALNRTGRFVAVFHGPYGSPLLQAARAFWLDTNARNRVLLVVDVSQATGDWTTFVRRVYREARLRTAAVFWKGSEQLLANNSARWDAVIAESQTFSLPTILGSDTAWDPAGTFHEPNRVFVRVEFPAPSLQTRQAIWLDRLKRENRAIVNTAIPENESALSLITSFQFTEGQIDDAVATARGLLLAPGADSRRNTEAEIYYEACRRQSARRIVSFAQRIPPRKENVKTEEDKEKRLLERVVLPEAAGRQLVELYRRMRDHTVVYHSLGFERRLSLGRGLVSLFTGPSGTGKTLAASSLSSMLQKDLYKVEMASVVSKYVGETEKNLNRVFNDAQDANAVLFFDEADALFGKRGDVEQAQDRWANLEVNFLLQRVEEYTGTVILATNFRHNIDNAFLRRVQVLIDFPKPNATARLNILRATFCETEVRPPDTQKVLSPIAERFEELHGGNLRNVVLDAVFRAVSESPPRGCPRDGVQVTTRHLVLGAAREYQKLGKPISPATFGRDWYAWVVDDLKLGA